MIPAPHDDHDDAPDAPVQRVRRSAAVAAADADDVAVLTELLGRAPRAAFEVVVREPNGPAGGDPQRAAARRRHADADPLLARRSRTWRARVARSSRPVACAPAERDGRSRRAARRARALRARARRRARRRTTPGPRPSGGVGGTRTGVKCLHAHYAFHLAGGDDPVGRWVAAPATRARTSGSDACGSPRSTSGRTRPACSSPTSAAAPTAPLAYGRTAHPHHAPRPRCRTSRGGSIPTRSSARSRRCASTARGSTRSAPSACA